jgi:hypothetical protein
MWPTDATNLQLSVTHVAVRLLSPGSRVASSATGAGARDRTSPNATFADGVAA